MTIGDILVFDARTSSLVLREVKMKEVKVLVLISWESGTTIVVNDGSRLRRFDELWDEFEQLWAVSNDWEKFPELYMEM